MHQEAQRQQQPLVAQLEAGETWGCMVIMLDTLLTSLDVLEAGRQSVEANRKVSKLKALAWVVGPEVEGNPFLLPRYRKLYQGLLETEVFETETAARAWLLAQLPSD